MMPQKDDKAHEMMPQGVFFLAVTGNVECNETLCQQLHGEIRFLLE